MKNIFVNGLSGKMGIALKDIILDDPDFEIVKTVSDSDIDWQRNGREADASILE